MVHTPPAVCEDSGGFKSPKPPRKCRVAVSLGEVAGSHLPGAQTNPLTQQIMSINSILRHMEDDDARQRLNDKERELAERVFIEKHLKECNPGMSDDKVRGRIKKAIGIAKMLYSEIYGG